MRNTTTIVVILFTALFFVLVGSISYNNKRIATLEQRVYILERERTLKDSLYRLHLEECSLISKDDVGIDERGYFYSKYHNNPIHTSYE